MHKGLIALLLLPGCITVTSKDDGNNTTDTGGTTTDTHTPPDPDNDGDGFPQSQDCDDSDAAINPDALEICDAIDNNCDEGVDDAAAATIAGANYASVDEALVAATDGASVDLCPGAWTFGSFALPAETTLTIRGVAGRDATTLSETDNLSGFHVSSGTLNLDGVTLTGSSAQASNAIEIDDHGTVNVSNSRITGNYRGVSLNQNKQTVPALTITDSDLDTNGTPYDDGGAIWANLAATVTLTNCNFTGNTGVNGGAYYGYATFTPQTLTVTDTVFDANSADVGGGLALFHVALVGSNVQITNNTATTAGGGVAITASPLSGALISGNGAGSGGGIAILFDPLFIGAGSNDLTGVVLDSNTADYGAGMWVDDAMVATLDSYSSVTLNAAGYAGGGAWLAGPDAEVVSTDADWGSYGTNDNTPDDLAYGDNTPVLVEGKATFDCFGDGTGCPTGGTTTTTTTN